MFLRLNYSVRLCGRKTLHNTGNLGFLYLTTWDEKALYMSNRSHGSNKSTYTFGRKWKMNSGPFIKV